MFATGARFDCMLLYAIRAIFSIVCVCYLVHTLLIFLFMLHALIILLILSNTFMFTFKYCCLIYMLVLLANYSHKSRLILGLSRSRVSSKIPTCLPLVSILIPLPHFGGLRDLRVQFPTPNNAVRYTDLKIQTFCHTTNPTVYINHTKSL